MFGFGNDKKKDNLWNFWKSNSNDEGWGFGGNKQDEEIEDLWGISEREDKSFWETLTDFFFR